MKYRLVNENITSNYGARLLELRGVTNIANFIEPTDDMIQDPADLDRIEDGARLLLEQMETGLPLLLIVDSDADGLTSGTIMYQYIKKIKPEQEIEYLLHDGKQHGLEDHWEKILQSKTQYSLVILPDSSSNDYEYHEKLKEIGLPCLVLDHHEFEGQFSSNAIIINNQMSENYKNKALTGAGMVYQFCRYLDRILKKKYADDFLDLAAIGIIADMGSVLNEENRYILSKGLHYPTPNIFLSTLYETQSYSITGKSEATPRDIDKALSPIAVAFKVSPLLNAMIRSGTSAEKERLFLGMIDGKALIPSGKRGSKGKMEKAAVEAVRECVNAKARQKKAIDAALDMIESKIHSEDLLNNEILFIKLEKETFPSELNGLVAMKLSSKYKKPTIVARLGSDGQVKGSIRGLNGTQLTSFKSFLESSGLFEYVSGHANAAGCGIEEDKIFDLHEFANKELFDVDFGGDYNINFERRAYSSDLSALIEDIAFYDKLWGQENPTPLIYISDIILGRDEFRVIGMRNDTLRFYQNGVTYIKFQAQELIEQIMDFPNETLQVNVIGTANMNEWNNKFSPQIYITDMEINTPKLEF